MQLLVMGAAQRDSELVANLAPERPRLGECQMMGVAWGFPAHQAGLLPDKQQVRLAAFAGRLLGMGEPGLGQRWLQRRLGVRLWLMMPLPSLAWTRHFCQNQ